MLRVVMAGSVTCLEHLGTITLDEGRSILPEDALNWRGLFLFLVQGSPTQRLLCCFIKIIQHLRFVSTVGNLLSCAVRLLDRWTPL